MTTSRSESDVHSRLYTRIKDYINKNGNETKFEKVYSEYTTEKGRADIYVENPTEESLIIEAKAPDKYLLKKDHIVQARNYARDLGFSTFGLVNTNDFFLFDYNDEVEVGDIDFYHLDLREFKSLSEAVPKILKAVSHLHYKDRLPEQNDKDQIIGLLRSFHSTVSPNYKSLAQEKYGKDRKFTERFDKWVKENDYTDNSKEEQFDILSKQFTYSIAIKILFYRILRENNIGKKHNVILEELGSDVGTSAIRKHIEQQFRYVCEKINYEPIFNEKNTVFESFPSNKKGQESIKNLLKNFRNLDITDVNEDLLGQLYEELIPKNERQKLGQFYTPPSVAETIVKWTVNNNAKDTPRVLDPACGSGTFPVEVYKHIEQNYKVSHQKIIDNISIIDINKFPLHLTGLNLAGRNISELTSHIDSHHISFFDYPDPTETGKFDAIVGNPPYIESGSLYPDQNHFRNHLKKYNPEGNKNPAYYNGVKRLSKKSDAYVYFVTNAIRYLNEGGRLGFIIPDKYLSTKYGESFQQFLFDNVKINSIVTFSKRTFEDALVNGSLLLIEKCGEEEKRLENTTDFIRLEDKFEPDELVKNIEYESDVDKYQFESTDSYTCVSVNQGILMSKKGKLSYLLKAPKQIVELIEDDRLVQLSDCAEIYYGNKTGANKFFFLDSDDISDWGISDKFLTPAIKSIRDVDSESISSNEVDLYILDFNNFVTEHDISSEEELISKLQDQNFTNTVKYIEYGKKKGYNSRSSCESRNIWCNIDNIRCPDLLQPTFYNERVFSIMNTDKLAPSNAIQCIEFTDKNGEAIAALTNTYIYKIILENWGRTEGGGALQLQTYELKTIPFPDINEFTSEEMDMLENSYQNIINGDYQGIADKVLIDRYNLDMTVGEAKEIQDNLVQSRVKGSESDPLIRDTDEIDENIEEFFEER